MSQKKMFMLGAALLVAVITTETRVKPAHAATTTPRNLAVATLPAVGIAAVDELSGTISVCSPVAGTACVKIGTANPGSTPSLNILVPTTVVPDIPRPLVTEFGSNYFLVVSSLTGDTTGCMAWSIGGQCFDVGIVPH